MKKLFILLTYLLFASFLAAQPISIIVDDTQVCMPDSLECTGFNGGIIVTTWIWELDGTIIATEQNTTIAFENYPLGVAELCLRAVDDQTDTFTTCITLQISEQPQVNIPIPDVLSCINTEIDLICFPQNNGAVYDYVWTGPQGTNAGQSIFVSLPGVYTVVVTDPLTGCTYTDDVTVLEDMQMHQITSMGPDTVVDCSTPVDLTLFATVEPSNGNYSYQWTTLNGNITGGANTLTPSINQTGVYELAVYNLDNGCLYNNSIVINGTGGPSGSISSDAAICEGESITLSYTAPSATSYLWPATGETTSTITVSPLSTTSYTAIAIDANGCSSFDQVDVIVAPVPISDIVAPTVTCSNSSIDLCGIDQAGYAYQWVGPGGLISNGLCITIPDNSDENYQGLYTLTVTDLAVGCTSSTDYQHSAVDAFEVTATTQEVSCAGVADGGVLLSVNGGQPPYTFNWNNSIPCQEVCTNLAAGSYLVTITDDNGCSIIYEFLIQEPALITIEDQMITCVSDSGADGAIDITVTGGVTPYLFEWSNAQNTEDVTGLIPGNYTLTITDVNNCQFIQNFEVPENCVWPGDTDTNKVVNNFDLLNIGLVFGDTGPARLNASLNWENQAATDWQQTIPGTSIDSKHADTDGNGVVDVNDTLAISLNWGQTHNLMGSSASPRNDLSLYVQEDTVSQGETMSLPIILGELDNPAIDIYGIAFSVTYDTSIVSFGSSDVSFTNSWLGTKGLDLITIQKDFPLPGRVDLAISRTDGMNVSGSGEIGRLNIIIEDDILLMSDQAETRNEDELALNFVIDRVKLINNLGEPLAVNPLSTTSLITESPLSNPINPLLDTKIELYPNPTRNYLTIQSEQIALESITLYSVLGELILQRQVRGNQARLDTQGLATGTYLVKLKTTQGTIVKRVNVVR